MTDKKAFVGGNWKCNGTSKKVEELVSMLNEAGSLPADVEVVVAPTALQAMAAASKLQNGVQVAVQNIWVEPKQGAFTGELTPDLVKDAGIPWVILGHSERRKFQKESPELVAEKTANALANGLKVIACIGETLEEREAGNTLDVCISQLDPIVAAIKPERLKDVVVAYEPVWAIGTGKTATPEQAQDVHKDLREFLSTKIGQAEADKMRIIYGGSVKASNCVSLIQKKDIDGFLVGGASLKPEFIDIIKGSSGKFSKI